jgi:hypothetical protein
MFNFQEYLENLDGVIRNILSRPRKNIFTYDLLDSEKHIENKHIVLQEKQRQMKMGEIWQTVLGMYDGFVDLKNGHETSMDLLSHSRKIIIELKNRTNTDNSSSRKTKFDKLENFKKKYPDYTCIYATINADTEKKTYTGSVKFIIHNGVEIQHQTGFNC